MYNNPLIADFKTYFYRDFPYNSDPTLGVTDTDIGNGYNMVNININQANWASQQAYTIGYLYLAAHYVVMNVRAGSQGVNGQYNWMQNSKSVQGVSEGFTIPQRVQDNPLWSLYSKTNYGIQYLQLLLPQLSGQIYSVRGRTRA